MPYDANARHNGPFLWVALDGLTENEGATVNTALALHEAGGNFGFKINGDLILKHGAWGARKLLPSTRPVFADTKLWNGAETMARGFRVLHNAGFAVANAYALAGGSYEGAGSELKKAIGAFRKEVGQGPHMAIYALTILTHYDGVYARRMFRSELPRVIVYLAQEGIQAGANGVIVPGHMLSRMFRFGLHPKIVPGIRSPGESNGGKHAGGTTAPEELAGRTDVEAVCGSPIMNSSDPVSALKRMFEALHWEMGTPT